MQPRASSAPTKGTVEAKPGYDKRGNIYPTNVKRGWVKFVTKEGKIDRQYRIKGVKGCQDHHILSDKNKWIINHPLLEELGYDLQDRFNRMLLPTKKGAPQFTVVRTIHDGKHVDKYSENLAVKLTEIETRGRSANYTREQYTREIDRVVNETYRELKDGVIHLNKNTRESAGLPLKGDPK